MSLSEGALEAFEALKQACMNSTVLAFADYTKDFLLETDASKEGFRAVFLPETGRWTVSPGGLWQLWLSCSSEHETMHFCGCE